MIPSKKALLMALLFPILALGALTLHKQYVRSFGHDVILPISGYDPRDLLSGHYLIYRIDYGVDGICPNEDISPYAGYVCLAPSRFFTTTAPDECTQLIRGMCKDGHFEAGIEKYYVPEDHAEKLEAQVGSGAASIVLSTTPEGRSQVKDLLIDGRSWMRK